VSPQVMQQIASGFKSAEVTSATLSAPMLRLLAGIGCDGPTCRASRRSPPARGNGEVDARSPGIPPVSRSPAPS